MSSQNVQVIPARRGSKRLPGKHLLPLLGRPLIEYTIEAGLAADEVDLVVVSSDDPALEPIAARLGARYLDRPPELCTDHAPIDGAIHHVCNHLERVEGLDIEFALLTQGNVPVRKEGQIDLAIRRLKAFSGLSSVSTALEERLRPEWFKVLDDPSSGLVRPFMSGGEAFRKQDFPAIYRIDGAVHVVRREVLRRVEGRSESHAWLGPDLGVLIQEHPMYSIEVDYPDELALAAFYLWYSSDPERVESWSRSDWKG